MQTLPRALADRLEVETDRPVSLVRPSSGDEGAPVEVDGEAFDVAVLAIPAPLALGLLENSVAPRRHIENDSRRTVIEVPEVPLSLIGILVLMLAEAVLTGAH